MAASSLLAESSATSGAGTPIDRRRAAELALAASEQRFRLMVDSVQDYAILMLSPEGDVTTWNAGAERIKGYRAEEIIGRHFSTFYPPQDVAAGKPEHELAIASAEGRLQDEGWRVRKDGTQFWANVVITALRDPAGTLQGYGKVTRDMTEARMAELALAASEQRFRQAFHHAPMGMAILATSPEELGRILDVNQGLCDLAGYDRDRLLTMNVQSLMHPASLEADMKMIARLLHGEIEHYQGETRYINAAADTIDVSVGLSVIRDVGGHPLHFVALVEDISSRKRRASELARSNVELEQFASIASHDLQEPLRKVRTFTERITVMEADQLSDKGRDYLHRVNAAAERMQRLIEDLLKFSRVATHGRAFAPVDLARITREVLVDLESVVERTGGIVRVGALPTIYADEPQIRQLIQNLLSNALKFCRDGVAPEVSINSKVLDSIAEITVRDKGIGFDPEYSERIFRVFERLNGRSQYPGTGVGLALCRKIAERHGGTIVADGAPDLGAIFTVTIPIEQREEAPYQPDHAHDHAAPSDKETYAAA
jgi:PAS domain S-box-containing protein